MKEFSDSDLQIYRICRLKKLKSNQIIVERINFRSFAQNFQRPFSIIYNPYTQSVEVLREMKDLKDGLNRFKSDLSTFTEAVEALNKNVIC